jgi:phosphoribosyl 1,2-cyclic phosphate phosphodiesterase
MNGKFIFLGTGSSLGVPIINCSCDVCLSPSPYNQRTRTSAFLEIEGQKILIDPGPDFRAHALKHKITTLDGVIITHTHYDHIGGLDELRAYSFARTEPLPALLLQSSFKELETRYPYLFMKRAAADSSIAEIAFTPMPQDRGIQEFLSLPFTYFNYYQGGMQVMGFRLGNFAYLTDLKNYTPDIFEDLKGVETLVVSGVKLSTSRIHLSIDEAVLFAKKVGAKKSYITHLSHEIDFETISKELPLEVQLAYDGLTLKIDNETSHG